MAFDYNLKIMTSEICIKMTSPEILLIFSRCLDNDKTNMKLKKYEPPKYVQIFMRN